IIKEEFTRSQREDEPLALVMLDLDNFKSVNDVYGHPFGDLVIKQFAQRLKKLFRPYDSVVRYGGEEFIILAPKTDRASALRLAGRIFRDTESRYFGNPNNLVRVNVSAAVVSYPENPVEKGEELVAAADHVLRKVKEDGGNRVYSSLDLRTRYNGISSKKGSVYELKNKLEKLTRRRTQTLLETIFAFARTIKQKDQYTGEHADRTVYYAGLLAKELKLAPAQVETIRQAAQLHDLGKIGVSEKILKKRGKLTAREFAEVKKHPQIGADILRPIQSLKEVVPMVLYHHERWDGKGYPYGLKGEAIPLGARIIALSDAFQALTFGRPYRRAYSLEKSIDIIAKEAGTKFDPEIVKAFTAVVTHNHGKSVLIPGKKRARRKV
ncbi:MAG TPA: diguanylate cyclase, partial [bacterium]|nr:diguanylate cyclase [bacterium]